MALTETQTEQLEKLLDTTTLQALLEALAGICEGKADHVSSNWQDHRLAAAWEKGSLAIGNAALKVQVQCAGHPSLSERRQ